MRMAGSHDLRRFSEPVIADTPASYHDGLALIERVANNIAGGNPIDAVTVGMTGVPIHGKRSTYASNCPDWDEKPIADDIERALDARVLVENDTALVGLGEAHFGAGEGVPLLVYVTVSTGVNGVRIVDGYIDAAALGFEIGEQFLSMEGGDDTLGEMISGRAIQNRFGVHPRELGKDSPVWDELAQVLAYGLHNTIMHWSPHRIVLGGSMFNTIGISVESVEAHLRSIMTKFPEIPEMVHSKLADFGGLYGGMILLRQAQDAGTL